MIGYYSYTVILTYLSLISSVTGMFLAAGFNGMPPHQQKETGRRKTYYGLPVTAFCRSDGYV